MEEDGVWCGRTRGEGPVVMVEVGALLFGELSPRRVDQRHVSALCEVESSLPPIVVDGETMEVLDGAHRLSVALRLGRSHIAATYFSGSRSEAVAEAVRLNSEHGKPLTRDERRRAAARLLELDATQSDRSIGRICGLSPTTVGTIRRRAVQSPSHGQVRRGKDGRIRRLPEREPLKVSRQDGATPDPVPTALVVDEPGGPWWRQDVALNDRCPDLVALLDRTSVGVSDILVTLTDLPASRRYQVERELRARADAWHEALRILE